jgi:hypothetical protein
MFLQNASPTFALGTQSEGIANEQYGLTRYRNGVTFELKCDQGTTAASITLDPCQSQNQCADMCAQKKDCQSCDFNTATKMCNMFGKYVKSLSKHSAP